MRNTNGDCDGFMHGENVETQGGGVVGMDGKGVIFAANEKKQDNDQRYVARHTRLNVGLA